jgi:hypothetical protein
MSINNPGDPTLWTGVLFVQRGMQGSNKQTGIVFSRLTRLSDPYASAILRFSIRFPASYPALPPLVIFNTDIFHPLIVPLTTYTFTTGSSNEAPVSATDEERLPPGGFSLRHGFPHWFGRAQRTNDSVANSRNVSGGGSTADTAVENEEPTKEPSEDGLQDKPVLPVTPKKQTAEEARSISQMQSSESRDVSSRISPTPATLPYQDLQKTIPVVSLLNYIRSTFDNETILDALPLEAAGNPGAWHAWKAHRRGVKGGRSTSQGPGISTPESSVKRGTAQARLPGEWNWEGVWAKRVRSGIEASQSDAMLFGNAPRGGEDIVSDSCNSDGTRRTH